jgi:multisubunit Na+/H+ antiporter MnhB subunit
MPTLLRALGVVVIAVGLLVAVAAGWQLAADERFREVAEAYARHPEHALFQGEYWVAAARHYGQIAAVVGGLVGGLSLGAMLLALAELVQRERRPR